MSSHGSYTLNESLPISFTHMDLTLFMNHDLSGGQHSPCPKSLLLPGLQFSSSEDLEWKSMIILAFLNDLTNLTNIIVSEGSVLFDAKVFTCSLLYVQGGIFNDHKQIVGQMKNSSKESLAEVNI